MNSGKRRSHRPCPLSVAISLRNRRGRARRSRPTSERASERFPSLVAVARCVARDNSRRGLSGLGERAKERRQGLGWLAFKVACRAQSPDLSPPQISSAPFAPRSVTSSRSLVLSLSLSLSLPERRRSPLFLYPSFSVFSCAVSLLLRSPSSRSVARDPRVQHRFSHKNSLRSTLSLGYYFLPGPAGVKNDATRRDAAPFRSWNSPFCKCEGGSGAIAARARNEEARAERYTREYVCRGHICASVEKRGSERDRD